MKRIALIDYARFVAAMSVMAYHYLFNGILNGKISSLRHHSDVAFLAKYGYLGVDLFFMISGYVIFFSAVNRTPEKFAVNRVVRLYPAFIVAVFFTSFFSMFWGGNQMSVSLLQVIANLTMMAPSFGQPFIDGVYWTLLYEIRFYALVLLILMLGAPDHLTVLFKAWPFAMLAASIAGYASIPFLGEYYGYFAAGALFAILKTKKDFIAASGLIICFGLSIAFALEKVGSIEHANGIVFSHTVVVGVVSAFYLFFFVINWTLAATLSIPFSSSLGALSYPVYLVHAHFGYMFISRFANDDNKWLIYICTLSIVILVAFLIHEFVEKKLSKVWKKFFGLWVESSIAFVRMKIFSLVPSPTPLPRTSYGGEKSRAGYKSINHGRSEDPS